MLLGEDSCRRQHRDLMAVEHSSEGRPHGYFGLAVAHVAAKQAVHGLAVLHVGEHGLDSVGLVSGFGVGEGIGKGAFPFDLGLKAHAFGLLAYRFDPQ